ncbi:terminase small subunit [Heyndrickxia camelliae]|uniref:Terminase small subunit n=1 Tax=Heyndrickxia camelliae TaxID=1707093 RepID=A0A2N3LNB9_9BACI|nr:terminase small subunit [Heyndrickxia camelliae]PKR86108.1 terminase small subunit [Heyndrickxia camelliae]
MLDERQKKFADLFLETGNATESYKQAGYKAKGNAAEAAASRLLRNVKVKAYIDEIAEQNQNNRIASRDEILEYLTKVMRGEISEEVPVPTKKGISIVDVDAGIKDRTKAAELLGKRYAMWTENKNIEGNLGVTIVDDIDD